jgi:PAS domain S-box-containing protein
MLVAASIAGWAIFARRALNVIPIARGLVIDQMNGLVFVLDRAGHIVDCNRPAAEAIAAPRHAWLGRSPEGIATLWATVLAGTLRSPDHQGRVVVGEASAASAFEWSVSELRDAKGRKMGTVCLFVDITQRWRAEEALRESEERFRNIADSAPVILWVSSYNAGVTFFNRQAAAFTGRAAEELTGSGWEKVVHPDDLARASAAFTARRNGGGPHQTEFRIRRHDGEYCWMLASTRPRMIGEVQDGWVGTCTDISDMKRQQADDVTRQKLESLGTLAGGIAHDFNNLLGSIHANAELALTEVGENSSPVPELRNICTASSRGAAVVRQLMTYSGREHMDDELVDVSALVGDMVDLLRVSVSKDALIETRLASGLPAVRANPSQLSQIVMNLVINASEALGDKPGVICVDTGSSMLNSSSQPGASSLSGTNYVWMQITDTGCGMTPEERVRIFEPFFTKKAAGRGLGLAVVQGIVRSLGGAIQVESAPGDGTTIRVLIPCATESPEHATEDRPLARDSERPSCTVMIVEDEEALLGAAAKLLRKAGFTVLEAADGSAALGMLQGNGRVPDVMLLDVTLPRVPSTDVLKAARRACPDLKVILTSAYSVQQVGDVFRGNPFDRFVRKPYRISDVITILRELTVPVASK